MLNKFCPLVEKKKKKKKRRRANANKKEKGREISLTRGPWWCGACCLFSSKAGLW